MFRFKKYSKIAQTLTLLFFATTLTACFNSSSSSSSNDSTTVVASLAVTSVAPEDGATDVGTNVKVVALFNKAIKQETLTETSFTLHGDGESNVTATVSYDSATMTAILDPGSNLSDNTEYTATITTSVQDESNTSLLEDYSWTFTTADELDETSPTVSSVSPEEDATDVLLNTKVTVVFDEAIDPASVTSISFKLTNDDDNDSEVTGSLRYVNPMTVVFTPEENLMENTDFTLTLSDDIKDLAGNGLVPFTTGFTTGTTVSASPDVVDLGTAGNYVILAETGISTTGTTSITGDIAVSPEPLTAITGFDPTLNAEGTFAISDLVTGKIFAAEMTNPTTTDLTTAIGDMQGAYVDAAGRVDPDFTELGAGEIGGMTLDPGLYKWGTGVLVTSDVTLNGDENDVWIFQIGQDLKLEDGKAIILTGGAQAKNVFWQVSEDVTLQAGATFNGIILTKTAVEAKAGAVINGRALAQTAVTLISNEVNEPAE